MLLGNLMEPISAGRSRFRTATGGRWSVRSPVLGLVAIVGFVLPILTGPVIRRRMALRRGEEGATTD